MTQDKYMSLRFRPRSKEAISLINDISVELWKFLKRSHAPRQPFIAAVGAIIADLTKASTAHPIRYSFRSLGAGDFTDCSVGYDTFTNAMAALIRLKYVIRREGRRDRLKKSATDRTSKFRAKSKLSSLLIAYGIDAADHRKHFRSVPRPVAIKRPIVLKSRKKMIYGKAIGGAPMPINFSDPTVAALAQQVGKLNAFFSKQKIEVEGEEGLDPHYAFQRIFNNGDDPGFNWDQGGRLYSIGADSYQNIKKKRRLKLMINGEATVELDIKASYITILRALRGEKFDAAIDPYKSVPDVPREIVKKWVAMTLGKMNLPRHWTQEKKQEYFQEYGGDLQKDYPIAMMNKLIPEQIPCLRGWRESKIRWGGLQYVESCAVISAVYTLAFDHDIPALPVHDSLIVPSCYEGETREVLGRMFQKEVGINPCITKK